MWAAERPAGQLALMRGHLGTFSDGRDSARAKRIECSGRRGYALQSRYIGPYLLYGGGARPGGGHSPPQSNVYALRYAENAEAQEVHRAWPIASKRSARTRSSSGPTARTCISRGAADEPGRTTRRPLHAAERGPGRNRSHGFFYRPARRRGRARGLPIIGCGRAAAASCAGTRLAAVSPHQSLKLTELGTLDSRADANANDGCKASCVDGQGIPGRFSSANGYSRAGYEIVEAACGIGYRRIAAHHYTPPWIDQISWK